MIEKSQAERTKIYNWAYRQWIPQQSADLLVKIFGIESKGKFVHETLAGAIEKGNLPIVRLLLEQDADMEVVGIEEPLYKLALRLGKWRIAHLLYEKGSDRQEFISEMLLANAQGEFLRDLHNWSFSSGRDPGLGVNDLDKQGKTSLDYAIEYNGKFAEIALRQLGGETSTTIRKFLGHIVSGDPVSVRQFLKENNFQLLHRPFGERRRVALHFAVELEVVAVIKELLVLGAAPLTRDQDGKIPARLLGPTNTTRKKTIQQMLREYRENPPQRDLRLTKL